MGIGGLSKVPEADYDLTESEHLDLSGNYLEELPTSINKLKNLKTLTLDNNQLRDLQFPHTICELSNLIMLSVSNNQLSVLPSNIERLKELKRLYLYNNNVFWFSNRELVNLSFVHQFIHFWDLECIYRFQEI